jgi:hypothetical protein
MLKSDTFLIFSLLFTITGQNIYYHSGFGFLLLFL